MPGRSSSWTAAAHEAPTFPLEGFFIDDAGGVWMRMDSGRWKLLGSDTFQDEPGEGSVPSTLALGCSSCYVEVGVVRASARSFWSTFLPSGSGAVPSSRVCTVVDVLVPAAMSSRLLAQRLVRQWLHALCPLPGFRKNCHIFNVMVFSGLRSRFSSCSSPCVKLPRSSSTATLVCILLVAGIDAPRAVFVDCPQAGEEVLLSRGMEKSAQSILRLVPVLVHMEIWTLLLRASHLAVTCSLSLRCC